MRIVAEDVKVAGHSHAASAPIKKTAAAIAMMLRRRLLKAAI
jgi:hypothetical protein